MKNTIQAHPEALFHCIADAFQSLEKANTRCKLMVIHPMCYAELLKEDKRINSKPHVITIPLSSDGDLPVGMMWSVIIYTAITQSNYEINVYSSDCIELSIDYPKIYFQAQNIISGS
jgi:hypothetical protein